MRLRPILFAVILVFCSVALPSIASAEIPFFGPIIPQTGSSLPGDPAATCPLGWAALITVVNNIISFLITIAIVAVAPIMIGYAGFLFVINPVNAGGKEEAKGILLHTIVGIIIALSAYLIVNAIMAVLYDPSEQGFGKQWYELVTSGGEELCIEIQGSLNQVSAPTPAGPPQPPPSDGTPPDGVFTYQSGISAQIPTASVALNQLLTCMAAIVPGNVGEISSISDSNIVNGTPWETCRTGGHTVCNHTSYSCHYGGHTCGDASYAVDFGDEQNIGALSPAASACGATLILNEGNHLHVSVGGVPNNCGCN